MSVEDAAVKDGDSSEQGSRSVLATDVYELIGAHPRWAVAFYSVFAVVGLTLLWATSGWWGIAYCFLFGFAVATVTTTIKLAVRTIRRIGRPQP